MPEIGLGIFTKEEELKTALEVFEKIKTETQDLLLERTTVVPNDVLEEIVLDFNLKEELAKIIFVLEFEQDIPRKLSANFYNFELQRLDKLQFELPDIYSFRVRFSIEEGFWIKYFVVDFPNKLRLKSKKLINMDRSIFGDLEGDKEDAASYIMERAFICNEQLRPVLESWVKDHYRGDYYNATLNLVCGLRRAALEKGELIINEISERFFSNIDFIGTILDEIPPQGWILKAKEEFKKIKQKILENKKDPKNIDWRLASEIILETHLMLELGSITLGIIDEQIREKKVKEIISKTVNTPKDEQSEDEISKTLKKAIEKSSDTQKEMITQLVASSYNKATVLHKEKPTFFAKNFIERIMNDLGIPSQKITKILKKFDNQFMFRMSPAGKKEHQNMDVDESVKSLLVQFILDILKDFGSYNSLKKEITNEYAANQNSTLEIEASEQSLIKPEEKPLREKILSFSEKELWILIRDEYLKELFIALEEIETGGLILKRFSLELGLLLTQGEASSVIIKELERKGIKIDSSNKEEVDTNICKIIFKEIKERKTQMR